MNPFDAELQLINTNTMIKNKLKELLSKLKSLKFRQYYYYYYYYFINLFCVDEYNKLQ